MTTFNHHLIFFDLQLFFCFLFLLSLFKQFSNIWNQKTKTFLLTSCIFLMIFKLFQVLIYMNYLYVPGNDDTSHGLFYHMACFILQMLRLALVSVVIVQALALPFDLTLDNEWELFKVAYKKNYGEEESNRSYSVKSIQYS